MSLDASQVAVLVKQIATQIIETQQQVLYTESNILPIEYIDNHLTGQTEAANLQVMMTYGTYENINNVRTFKNKADKITLSLFDQNYYDYSRTHSISNNQFIVKRNGSLVFDEIQMSDLQGNLQLDQLPLSVPDTVYYTNSQGVISAGKLPSSCIQSILPTVINPQTNTSKVLTVDQNSNVAFTQLPGAYLTNYSLDLTQKSMITSNLPQLNQYHFLTQTHGGFVETHDIADLLDSGIDVSAVKNWPTGILIGSSTNLDTISYITNAYLQDNSISGSKIISLDFSKIVNFSLGDTTFPDNSINISALQNTYSPDQLLCLDSSSNYQLSKIYTALFDSNSISGAVLSNGTIPLSKIVTLTPNRILATDGSGNITQLTQLTSSNIPNSTITSAMIAGGTIVNSNISNSAQIALSKINFGNTPNQSKVFTDNLTFAQMSFDNLSGVMDVTSQIADKSINVQKIQDTNVPYQVLVTDQYGVIGFSTGLSTNYINNNQITGSQMVNQTITATQLANQSVTASKILNGTITDAQVSTSAAIDISKINFRAPNDANYFLNGNSTWVPIPSAAFPAYSQSVSQFLTIGTDGFKQWSNDVNSICSAANIQYTKIAPAGQSDQILTTNSSGQTAWEAKSSIIPSNGPRTINITALDTGTNGQNINTLLYNDGTGVAVTYSKAFNLSKCNDFFASNSIDSSKIYTGFTSQYLVTNSSQNIIGQTGIPVADIKNTGNLTNDQLVIYNKTLNATQYMSYPSVQSYLTFASNSLSWTSIPKIFNITDPVSAGNYLVYWDNLSQIYMTSSNVNNIISNNQIQPSRIQSTGSLYDSVMVSYSNGTSAWTPQQTNSFMYFNNSSVTQYLTGTNGTAKFPYFDSSALIGTTADATQFIANGGLSISKLAPNSTTNSFLISNTTLQWSTDCTSFIANNSIAFSKLTQPTSIGFLGSNKGDTSLQLIGNADITQDALYYMKYTSGSVQNWFNLTGNNQLIYFNASGALSKLAGTSQFPYYNDSSNLAVTSDATQFIGTNALSIGKIAGNGTTDSYLRSSATNSISWSTDVTPFIATGGLSVSKIANNGATASFLSNSSSTVSWSTSIAPFIADNSIALSKLPTGSGFRLLGTDSAGGNITSLFNSTITYDTIFYMKKSTNAWAGLAGTSQGFLSFQGGTGNPLSILSGSNTIPYLNSSVQVNGFQYSGSSILYANASSALSSFTYGAGNNGQVLGVVSGNLAWTSPTVSSIAHTAVTGNQIGVFTFGGSPVTPVIQQCTSSNFIGINNQGTSSNYALVDLNKYYMCHNWYNSPYLQVFQTCICDLTTLSMPNSLMLTGKSTGSAAINLKQRATGMLISQQGTLVFNCNNALAYNPQIAFTSSNGTTTNPPGGSFAIDGYIAYINTSGSYVAVSDRSVKNILKEYPLYDEKLIEGYRTLSKQYKFNYKNDQTNQQLVGFMWDEMNQHPVFRHMCQDTQTEGTTGRGLDTTNMLYSAMRMCQQLQLQVDQLTQKTLKYEKYFQQIQTHLGIQLQE